MDFRSLVDNNGLLGFRKYLNLILSEIVEGRNSNTVHDIVLERLVGYYSSYRNSGDLDFRSGEIYNAIKNLSETEKQQLAKHFSALLAVESVECSSLDWTDYIKSSVRRDE
jgi:hypothetical protein